MFSEKKIIIFIFFIINCFMLNSSNKIKIYLFPGQGSDYRIFKELNFPENYDTVCFNYPVPKKNETLKKYSYRFIEEIDKKEKFILIGVSLGGMICSELADTLNAYKIIIISSAKYNKELPKRYTFQQNIPINKLVPKQLTKKGAIFLQPIVEPARKKNAETFKSMIKSKNALYLKRTVNMIINWDKKTYSKQIIHIHGTNDHTIPYKNIDADYTVNNGSHMMVLTKSKKINSILNLILNR